MSTAKTNDKPTGRTTTKPAPPNPTGERPIEPCPLRGNGGVSSPAA
jgi:hypothetical protein